MDIDKRISAIKIASWIGISGNALLALLKLITGSFANSLSVLADGIDSSGDVLISVITLYIASLIARPPNIKFPYGYAKAETNATNLMAFIIFFAGIQLGLTSGRKLISGEIIEMPGKIAIIVMCISVIGKLILAWQIYVIGKKVNSNMLLANFKNMMGDMLISASVLVGLVFAHVFKLPFLDPIAALLVSVWIIWVAVRIFIATNIELMDGNMDSKIYKQLFQIVETVPGVINPHRLRIRNIGPKKMVNIDIEVNENIPISEAHRIAHMVEDKIKSERDDIFDVSIHVEPYGKHIEEKKLGISKDGLNEHK